MKKKIVGILVVTLLIVTVVLPVIGGVNIEKNQGLIESIDNKGNVNYLMDDESFEPWRDGGKDDFISTSASVEVLIIFLGTIEVTVEGPTSIRRWSPEDPGDGRWKIDTEIVSMDLSGDSALGSILISESPIKKSTGLIRQRVAGKDFPADSFFDVYIEIQANFGGLDVTLHNEEPVNMTSIINNIPPYMHYYISPPRWIPLYDQCGCLRGWIKHASHKLPPSPNKSPFSGIGYNLSNVAYTPPIDLTEVNTATLRFWTQYEINSPDGGYIHIQVDGGAWTIFDEFEGSVPDWIEKSYDLSAIAGHIIQLRFVYRTKCYLISEGWHVDSIIVEGDGISLYYEDFEDYEVGEYWDYWIIEEKPASWILLWPYFLIEKPVSGTIYANNGKIFSLPLLLDFAVVIGPITVMITPEGEPYPYHVYVEFYVDDELRHIDNEPPYEWLWEETSFGKHTLKVLGKFALNPQEPQAIYIGEMEILKLF